MATPGRTRAHLRVHGDTHEALGAARGALLTEILPEASAKYTELFRTLGVREHDEQQACRRTLERVQTWRPEYARELLAVAEAAHLDPLKVVALNARTELLSLAPNPPVECSTVISNVQGRSLGVQTWDWYEPLDPFWHTHEVAGPGYGFAGLTEAGILGKIGVNAAGLAVHFNILRHRDDTAGGVPVHMLARAVLSECATVAEAEALIRATPTSASTSLTMHDTHTAVSVEISPAGAVTIPLHDGSVLRTNHFQDPTLHASQRPGKDDADSEARLALLQQRLADRSLPHASALVELLETTPGEPTLTCRPDQGLPAGVRMKTLATVITDPQSHSVRVLDGTPVDAAGGASWATYLAPTT